MHRRDHVQSILSQSGRSTGVKLNGEKAESGRSSIKLDAPKDKTWTAKKGGNWTFLKYESERPNRLKVDGTEMKKIDSLMSQHLTTFGDKSKRPVNLGLGCV